MRLSGVELSRSGFYGLVIGEDGDEKLRVFLVGLGWALRFLGIGFVMIALCKTCALFWLHLISPESLLIRDRAFHWALGIGWVVGIFQALLILGYGIEISLRAQADQGQQGWLEGLGVGLFITILLWSGFDSTMPFVALICGWILGGLMKAIISLLFLSCLAAIASAIPIIGYFAAPIFVFGWKAGLVYDLFLLLLVISAIVVWYGGGKLIQVGRQMPF